jgi:hypothetical protein
MYLGVAVKVILPLIFHGHGLGYLPSYPSLYFSKSNMLRFVTVMDWDLYLGCVSVNLVMAGFCKPVVKGDVCFTRNLTCMSNQQFTYL